MSKAIYFDMDGTLAATYAVDGWLESLRKSQTKPYREAKPLVDMRILGRQLNDLKSLGYHIGVISWGSKVSTDEYLEKVERTKISWLSHHLGAVEFDEIKVVHYGTPKSSVADIADGILFDDEAQNREAWNGTAYDADNILEVLSRIILNEIDLLGGDE